ncbi:pyridoxal phosphate-dependent aminotransferase [Thalassobacillus pellis]|uniref:pyridoxal phosphate-dependent aminotransferase n=1 Tax=Thalassobacillus pellis TaxID=748008 RepID=UPI001961164E|nr:pyridoxal phosphate-dependent aminotransferase [Thalassobacillus pellis]MBM7551993.1 aminotransferase [Thalassobacillus pellis]
MKTYEHSDMLKQLPDQFFAILAERVQKAIAAGHDVINLGQGSPDKPAPSHVIDRLKTAAEEDSNHRYPPFRGKQNLLEAIAEFYDREYGVEIDPNTEVAILFGAKAGLVELPQCLMNPGDIMLVPDPGYPDYWSGPAIANVDMHPMPLRPENGFLPDYKEIPEDVLKASKLMILNYPNNPTGAMASPEFFQDTIKFAEQHDLCVAHDFAYGAIGFDGNKPESFLQQPGAKEVGVEIYTMSKTYNMAGWRIAFAVGNPSVIEAINIIQDHYYCSVFGAVQDAAAEALTSSQKGVDELVDLYEERREALIKGAHAIGWDVDAPEGSFFAWLKVPEGYTSESFSDLLLEEAKVLVAPGIGFGKHGEGYVRVGLVTEQSRIEEALDRIKQLHIF